MILGAALTPLTSSQDLNDLKTVGDYYAGGTVASTLQHCPVTGSFTLNVRSTTDNLQTSSRVIQTIVVNAVLPSIYRRTFTASGWSSWYLNYDESMLSQPTLLSPLATALGSLMARQSGFAGDADTLTAPGIYSHTENATNTPFPYGILIVFQTISNYTLQIDINLSSGKAFAFRTIGSVWKYLATDNS